MKHIRLFLRLSILEPCATIAIPLSLRMEMSTTPADEDIEHNAKPTDRVALFRDLIGVFDIADAKDPLKKRKTRNIGLYRRLVVEERKVRLRYLILSTLINACLLLQVVFASILTSLGASSSSHILITIFGAFNTVIAAFLSFTKGQGLPNRLRLYQSSLRKVREHVEIIEREFAEPGCKLDVATEVQTIIAMYDKVRTDHEKNHPDAYAPTEPARTANGSGERPLGKSAVTSEVARIAPLIDRLIAGNEIDRKGKVRVSNEHAGQSDS